MRLLLQCLTLSKTRCRDASVFSHTHPFSGSGVLSTCELREHHSEPMCPRINVSIKVRSRAGRYIGEGMTLRNSTILILLLAFVSCRDRVGGVHDMSGKQSMQSFIPDTTKSWLGRAQYQEYLSRKKLAQTFKLPDLEQVNETSEVRIWWPPFIVLAVFGLSATIKAV